MARSDALREEAIGLLTKAKALTDDQGDVKPEDAEQFDALMNEFRAKDAERAEAETREGNVTQMSQRFAEYTAKVTGEPMRFVSTTIDAKSKLTPGQQFIQSDEYKKLVASGVVGSPEAKFRSLPVTVGQRLPYGAATTDVINTGTNGPGADLVQPYRPGIILPLPQRPLVVRDLFANVDMPGGDTIEYAAQVGFDNGAAAFAQAQTVNTDTLAGGLKPQSSVAWEERTAKATWIGTWMVATRQALADETQMASLIDNQGRLMVRIAEDTQLLNGNGTAPNLSGLRDQTGLQTLDLSGGADNLDGIRTARRLVKTGLSRLDATFLVLNPVDSEEFDLLKDGNGQYRGGNPIGGFANAGSAPIWGLTRVESEAMPEGFGLVGTRAGATIFDREPLRVLTTDSHSDFFVRNLIVVLFEERLAFPVYFPTAFVEVEFDDWAAQGSGSGAVGTGGGL